MTGRQMFVYQVKQMGRRSWSSCKAFALMGLIFSSAECVVEKVQCHFYFYFYFFLMHSLQEILYDSCEVGKAKNNTAKFFLSYVPCTFVSHNYMCDHLDQIVISTFVLHDFIQLANEKCISNIPLSDVINLQVNQVSAFCLELTIEMYIDSCFESTLNILTTQQKTTKLGDYVSRFFPLCLMPTSQYCSTE